jgi:hypothetical protein
MRRRRTRETVYVRKDVEVDGGEERLLGVLGRARSLYPVDLHGFLFARDRIELLMTVSSRVRLAGFLMHLYRNVGGFGAKGTQDFIRAREDAEKRWRELNGGRVVAVVSSARAVRAGIEMIGVWNGVAYHVPVVPLPRRLTVVEVKHVAA